MNGYCSYWYYEINICDIVDIDNDTNLDFFVGQDYTTETTPTMGRLYYFNNDELQKLYQLDNTIKLSIFKNIDIFKTNHKTFYDSSCIDNDKTSKRKR